MQNKEVKPSWSASHIILTVVLSFITYGIGYFWDNVFDRSEKRILTVIEDQTENLLNLDQKVHDEIITTYTLRNNPSESVKSYFRYSATIHNTSDIGVEKLKVFVQVDNSDVILAKTPSITTAPPDIHQGIILQQNKQVIETSKDEWEVSLLNPHESITFAYIGYSTKGVDTTSFKLIPRKKDWQVIREEAKTFSESNSLFDKTITEIQGVDLFLIIAMFVSIQIVVPLYISLLKRIFPRSRGLFGKRSVRDDSNGPTDST